MLSYTVHDGFLRSDILLPGGIQSSVTEEVAGGGSWVGSYLPATVIVLLLIFVVLIVFTSNCFTSLVNGDYCVL